MSEPKGKILANALNYMAGQGAMAAFGLITSIVLARYLPKTVFGQYSYLLALAILFLPFLDMGGHTLYAVLGARGPLANRGVLGPGHRAQDLRPAHGGIAARGLLFVEHA